ncbi:MAG: TraB/GumN family protein [Sphingobacteriales bacterium]|nr:TraB/GumN family protein [Sphingobacteriales bacterium]
MRRLSMLLPVFILQQFYINTSPAQTGANNSLLWEITGNRLANPSYLYGTIHMICKKDFFISDKLKQKFASANKLYLEVDMDDPSVNMKMLQLSMLKGKKLSDFFSDSDYSKLNDFFRDTIKMPLTFLGTMKPFVLFSIITLKTLPCQDQKSYEMTFVEMAKEQSKEVLGLETIEDQMKIFDDMPDSTQAQMVMRYVNDFNKQKSDFAKMVEVYKKQNLDSLYEQISTSPDIEGSEDALLFDRNARWIPVMEDAMKEQSVFFAVGAGHLAGDKGVINLLRQQGYTVAPVK